MRRGNNEFKISELESLADRTGKRWNIKWKPAVPEIIDVVKFGNCMTVHYKNARANHQIEQKFGQTGTPLVYKKTLCSPVAQDESLY